MKLSRRTFLSLMGASTVTTAFAASYQNFYTRLAQGNPIYTKGFGSLRLDPHGILDLPDGFTYRLISQMGQPMTDGSPVPPAFDGMAAFAGDNDTTILVRNHELIPPSPYGVTSAHKYDPRCQGGTTTLILDSHGHLISEFVSLSGTNRNCAGGVTPWGTWISCEEDTSMPSDYPSSHPLFVERPHGYNFEVSPLETATSPIPLKAMGRFRHEAIAVDPSTGYLYQTEDQIDSCFYRFIPNESQNLKAGGRLDALMIQGQPKRDTSLDFPLNQPFSVQWIPLETVDPIEDTLRYEAHSKGSALFRRGEGLVWGTDGVYWTCTNGGNAGFGQIFYYHPKTETIRLLAESPNQAILDYPDNLVLSPWGDLILCEDGQGEQFLKGLTPEGKIYPFARNALNNSELAGVCFSANGKTLFVNIYHPGLTLAIEGNWHKRVKQL